MIDTGVGMGPEQLAKLAEPLLSTKARGLGLGLAISRAILEKNGGLLRVESEPGRGTTFTVALPRGRRAPGDPAMSESSPAILLVDDDVDACRNVSDILGDLGYTVDVAHDGPSALEMAEGRTYDVALLDLRMPGGWTA